MSEPVDWYENRHDLLCEQVFRCHDGTLVRLNRTVPGDGTKWYVDDWDGSSWAICDSTIEPGDLFELVPDPEQADAALAELTARRARDAAVEALFAAAEGAYYRGLMVGEDCAWALAKLQREGVYKPMCADGKPSNADADRDEKTIQSCRGALKAALTLFAGDKT